MGQWQFLFEDRQEHRVVTLGTDSPIRSPDYLTRFDSSLSGSLSFVPLPPISETEGETYPTIEPLIPTMPAQSKLTDPVTK